MQRTLMSCSPSGIRSDLTFCNTGAHFTPPLLCFPYPPPHPPLPAASQENENALALTQAECRDVLHRLLPNVPLPSEQV